MLIRCSINKLTRIGNVITHICLCVNLIFVSFIGLLFRAAKIHNFIILWLFGGFLGCLFPFYKKTGVLEENNRICSVEYKEKWSEESWEYPIRYGSLLGFGVELPDFR